MNLTITDQNDLFALVEQTRARAEAEPNQGSYNAAYLYGYADAFRDLANAVDVGEFGRHYEMQCLLEDAKTHLFDYFDQDEGEFFGTFGFPYESAADPASDNYMLDRLVLKFEHDRDANVSENNTWDSVISQCITELGVARCVG